MKERISKVLDISGNLLLVLVILICVPLTVPRLFGYNVYSVISGSMEPAIPTGSLIYVTDAIPKELQKEEIIAFYGKGNQGSIITHRVFDNRIVEGELITKGDANDKPDVNPVKYTSVVGKVKYHIPYMGAIGQFVSNTIGKVFIGLLIALKLIFSLISYKLTKKCPSM